MIENPIKKDIKTEGMRKKLNEDNGTKKRLESQTKATDDSRKAKDNIMDY